LRTLSSDANKGWRGRHTVPGRPPPAGDLSCFFGTDTSGGAVRHLRLLPRSQGGRRQGNLPAKQSRPIAPRVGKRPPGLGETWHGPRTTAGRCPNGPRPSPEALEGQNGLFRQGFLPAAERTGDMIGRGARRGQRRFAIDRARRVKRTSSGPERRRHGHLAMGFGDGGHQCGGRPGCSSSTTISPPCPDVVARRGPPGFIAQPVRAHRQPVFVTKTVYVFLLALFRGNGRCGRFTFSRRNPQNWRGRYDRHRRAFFLAPGNQHQTALDARVAFPGILALPRSGRGSIARRAATAGLASGLPPASAATRAPLGTSPDGGRPSHMAV